MVFDRPQTKDEMYSTLNDIYFYYNHRRLIFNAVEHEELIIPRMTYLPLTDEEISEKATTLLIAKHTREKQELKKELTDKISSLRTKLNDSVISEEKLISSITERYKEAFESFRKKSWQNGVSDSSIVTDGLKEIENKKADEILKITNAEEEYREDLQAQITTEEENLSNIDEYLDLVHAKEIEAKSIELKKEQEDLSREIHRYNAQAEEKEIKYKNSMKNTVADMEIRYLGIHEVGFTEDELIEMGYYEDVLKCVSWYYEQFDDETAYHDIKNESSLLIYLRGYYSMMVQVYKIRATGTA